MRTYNGSEIAQMDESSQRDMDLAAVALFAVGFLCGVLATLLVRLPV